MRVCRSCYEPVTVRVKPGQGFVCHCFVPQKDSKRMKRLKAQEKRREEKNAVYA
jgi:hypothetical protein